MQLDYQDSSIPSSKPLKFYRRLPYRALYLWFAGSAASQLCFGTCFLRAETRKRSEKLARPYLACMFSCPNILALTDSNFSKGITMKRLVIAAACLAMLTFSGCAGGILGGLCNNGCNNSSPSLFGNGGLFADGPVRQFMRGDACDSCNSAAGQIVPQHGPTCDSCGSIVPNGGYTLPTAPPTSQPATSFYPGETVHGSFPQQHFHDGGVGLPGLPPAADNSAIPFGSLGTDLTVPPAGIN